MKTSRNIAYGAVAALVLMGAACGQTDDNNEPGQAAETEGTGTSISQEGEQSTGGAEGSERAEVTFVSGFPTSHVLLTYLYVPQELGYFADEGLDVVIEHANGSSQALQLVLSGQGISTVAAAATTFDLAGQGQDVVSVCQNRYGINFDFVVPAGSDITSFDAEAIRGTSIGVSEFSGGEVPLLRGALAEIGLSEGEDVELLPVGEGDATTLEAIRNGTVDMYAGSKPDIAAMQAAGEELEPITPSYMSQFAGDSYVVTQDTYAENPELITKFLRAIAKGNYAIRQDLNTALEIAEIYAPESFDEPDFPRAFMEATFLPLQTPPDDVDGICYHQREGWENYQSYLLDHAEAAGEEDAALDAPLDLDALLSDDLLEEVNGFDEAEVQADVEAYGG